MQIIGRGKNLKFDVIAFLEVLEHQDDPVGFLEAVERMLNKKLRQAIIGSEYVGEGTSLYRQVTVWKKVVLKALKFIRFGGFLVPALVIKQKSDGTHLYFQAKL